MEYFQSQQPMFSNMFSNSRLAWTETISVYVVHRMHGFQHVERKYHTRLSKTNSHMFAQRVLRYMHADTCTNMITMRPDLCEYRVSLNWYPQSDMKHKFHHLFAHVFSRTVLIGFENLILSLGWSLYLDPCFSGQIPWRASCWMSWASRSTPWWLTGINLMALVDDDEAP